MNLGGKRKKVLQWKGRGEKETLPARCITATRAQPTVTERKAEGGRKTQEGFTKQSSPGVREAVHHSVRAGRRVGVQARNSMYKNKEPSNKRMWKDNHTSRLAKHQQHGNCS